MHAVQQSPVSVIITDKTGKIEFINTGEQAEFIRYIPEVERVLIMTCEIYGRDNHHKQSKMYGKGNPGYMREKLKEYHETHFTTRPIFRLLEEKTSDWLETF